MSDTPTNPLGLLWLLVALLLCGALMVIPVSSDTEQIFEQFSMESSSMTAENIPTPIFPANADVVFVSARETAPGTWTFTVTVAHPDTGWDDYADGWDVVLPDGTVILPNPADPFTRLLLHPHENEQPFTRSQSGIVIPADVSRVRVRAHDLVDGWGGHAIAVDLTVAAGEGFEVQRQ